MRYRPASFRVGRPGVGSGRATGGPVAGENTADLTSHAADSVDLRSGSFSKDSGLLPTPQRSREMGRLSLSSSLPSASAPQSFEITQHSWDFCIASLDSTTAVSD